MLIILLSLGLLALGINIPSLASSPSTIQINGSDVVCPLGTFVSGGQVMVPIRWMAGQLGATSVQWDSTQRNISIDTGVDFYHLSKLNSFANALNSDEKTNSATERFDVEQLVVGGQEGWFITKMLQSSGYGLL